MYVYVSKFVTTAFHFFSLADFCLFIFNSLVLSLEEAEAFLWKSWSLLRAQDRKTVIPSELKN